MNAIEDVREVRASLVGNSIDIQAVGRSNFGHSSPGRLVMKPERIFARKIATRMLSPDETGVVAGGSYPWNTTMSRCVGPQGNPGDWAAGIIYYVDDDCPPDEGY